MGKTQRFKLRETVPGLPGEKICAADNCLAPETMAEDSRDDIASELVMEHTDDCTEVRRLAAGG